MKYSILILFLTILITGFLFTGCRKDDNGQKSDQQILSGVLTGEINSDSILSTINWLQNMGTRFALSGNRKNVAVGIMNRFTGLGYSDVVLDSFQITTTWQSITYTLMEYNVIATIKGSESPDSISIVGAHYDDILSRNDPTILAPGANDNASGVAATIEIARAIKKINWSPKSTIRFIAFGAEEQGLLGSGNYSSKAAGKMEGIKFMLNHDMIAYEPSNDMSLWKVNIMDYDNSHSLREFAQEMCLKYTLLNFINVNTYNRNSDSYSFARYGYKAIFFYNYSSDPNYHTLNDISSYCNPKYCAEIAKISCSILVNKD
jgi:bacterial leucyl aminopeptidase